MQTEGSCVSEVATGRADAFLYDQLSILGASRANPGTTRALLTPLTREPYAMATRHGDEKFVERLNEFLRTIREDGRYQTLREVYLRELPDGSR
jgi:polar amino acid transport system substrate-binding protein